MLVPFVIVKMGSRYVLRFSDGREEKFDTKAEAEKRERQVQFFKTQKEDTMPNQMEMNLTNMHEFTVDTAPVKSFLARVMAPLGALGSFIMKQAEEAPVNEFGFTVGQTLDIMRGRGRRFTKDESVYQEPADDPMKLCGACRLFIRSEFSDEGTCQVVGGSIRWNGTSKYYISAADEGMFAFGQTYGTEVDAIEKQAKPKTTTIQTLIFDKDKFTSTRAKAFLKRNDFLSTFRSKGVDETDGSLRFAQMDVGAFQEGTFRTIDLDEGVKAVIGRPKREGTRKASHMDNRDKKQSEHQSGHENDEDEKKKKKKRESKDIFVPIRKFDEEKRVVVGVVMEPDVVDTQGEYATVEVIEKAAHTFLEDVRVMGQQHLKQAGAIPVESYVTHEETTMGGELVRKGSWIIASKIIDDELLEAIQKGEYTGFSVSGWARKTILSEAA